MNLDFNYLLQKLLAGDFAGGKKSRTKLMRARKKRYRDKCRERYVKKKKEKEGQL